jgi:dTDP-4-dehydrorhamnose reductase
MFGPNRPAACPPLPLLITGITGVTGYHALRYFQSRYPGQVIGIRQENDERLAGPGVVACNAEDRAGLSAVFRHYRFASVLNCAGNCALKPCELNPEMAWRINVEGVANLLSGSVHHSARLVHLSVDMVFSGGEKKGDRRAYSEPTGAVPFFRGYREDDPVDPVTVYGKTMAAAEKLILETDPGACILRISLPMGVSLNGHAGAIDWISSRFKKSRPATLYLDEVRTPTYTDCLTRLGEVMLANRLAGLYHAGGPRRVTLYQIGQIINRVGGYDPNCLLGIPRREAGPIPPRAGNVSMDSSKLIAALGYNPFDPWPLDESLVPTDPLWHFQRPADESRSPEHLDQVLAANPTFADHHPVRRPKHGHHHRSAAIL